MNQSVEEKPFRAFFGIIPPDETLEKILQIIAKLSKDKPNKIRWINKENLHITLTFLGNIFEKQSQELITLLQNDLINFTSFEVTFSSLLALPSEKFPRVLTLFAPNAEHLIQLEATIRHHASNCGITTEERAYKPHITIARIKGKYHFDNLDEIQLPKMTIPIKDVTLFRSDLTEKGAIYTVIATLELKEPQ